MGVSVSDFHNVLLSTRFQDSETGNIWRFDCVTDLFFIEGHDMRLTDSDVNGYFYVLILVHFESPQERNKQTHYPVSYDNLVVFTSRFGSPDLVDDEGDLDRLLQEMGILIEEGDKL